MLKRNRDTTLITNLSSVYSFKIVYVPILPQVDEFLELVKTSDKQDELLNNVTVFVPSNDAVEDFRHDMEAVIELPVVYIHIYIYIYVYKNN